MKHLQQLHEEFIDSARRPMSFGRLPISPSESEVVIVPVNRWTITKSPHRMKKMYDFLSIEARNRFIKKLLAYEVETQHNAVLTIEENLVTINLYTKDVEQVTELDKEYAKFADTLYKDIVYNP